MGKSTRIFILTFFLSLPFTGRAAAPAPGSALAYPSPANGGFVHFAYDMPSPGDAMILIYNEAGDLIAQWRETKGPGLQESLTNTAYYTPGVYFFRVLLYPVSGGVVKLKMGKFSIIR